MVFLTWLRRDGWVSVMADRPLLEVAEAIQTALLTRAASWQR